MITQRKAFTLIELLVVIAIIAILAAILFPVFAQAKTAAKKAADLSNVKQIATAQVLYVNDWDGVVAMNRSCNLWREPTGPANREPCQAGDIALGWIDLANPYIKSIDIFKSGGDGTARVPLPATGTLCYHWERASGSACTARNGSLTGYVWGGRVSGGTYTPLGGDFRSSYARNNNFANNGVYQTSESQIQFASNTIMILPMQANTGAGANGNEGVPGSTYNINRRDGIVGGGFPAGADGNVVVGTPNATIPGCLYGAPQSTGNNQVSFVHTNAGVGSAIFNQESGDWSSRRFSGGSNYSMVDTSARFLRPNRVNGQCGWGQGRIPEPGNDGSTPDFRI
jgi:prepilin-type N-terminal cleavage/methylation domain-containing protein